jgi:hypothetical protein
MVRKYSPVATLAAVIMGVLATSSFAHNGEQHAKPIEEIPEDQPDAGLVYKDLEIARTGPMRRCIKLGDSNRCTHGPDAAPAGVDVDVAPIGFLPVSPSPKVQCDGDGVSGKSRR